MAGLPVREFLPHRLNVTIGRLGVGKGTSDDGNVYLYSWDAIQDCEGERCPAHEFCEFDQRGKCTVMRQYLKSVMTLIFRNFAEDLTEPHLYRIGMHLMPLYKMLCRMKIEEMAVRRVVTVDDKGKRAANPLYKEIRETIKLIEQTWKRLGLDPLMSLDPDFEDENFMDGNPPPKEKPKLKRK